MEVHSATFYGWKDSFRTVEKRTTFDYEKGNDVTVVERKSFQVTLYDSNANLTGPDKGTNIDQMV